MLEHSFQLPLDYLNGMYRKENENCLVFPESFKDILTKLKPTVIYEQSQLSIVRTMSISEITEYFKSGRIPDNKRLTSPEYGFSNHVNLESYIARMNFNAIFLQFKSEQDEREFLKFYAKLKLKNDLN